ncbi:MAG: hypothetical protein M1541_10415 [Acidobacteria bacterium]|nr:hypothetical protein [Acidobacteriota bacterium]
MATNFTGMQLHYRCSFDITAIDGSGWGEVIKSIRSWVQKKVGQQDQVAKAWCFRGGAWRHSTVQRMSLHVVAAGFNEAEAAAPYWALRLEHPDRDFSSRQWCIDIGVTIKGPELFGFSMIVSHGVLPGFIGDEPAVPIPTAPNLVHSFLEGKRWTAVSGSEELVAAPRTVPVGEGNTLSTRLTDIARGCPIVYVSRTAAGDVLLDAKHLAWLLAGTAVVYVPESHELDSEMEWFLPRPFRASKGMVRIYVPSVRPAIEADARRHRFFTPEEIAERTPVAIQSMIIRGVARRVRQLPADRVAAIEDVVAQQHQIRIQELKRSVEQRPNPEWVAVLEELNTSLEKDALRYRDQLETMTELAEGVEAENEELKHQAAKLKYEKEQLIAWHTEQEKTIGQLRGQIETVHTLANLPDTISAVVETIGKLHPTTIEFTAQARQSAEQTQFSDAGTAWRILWSMATTLHDLYFKEPDQRLDIARRFKELSGFDLALNEGKDTSRDRKLMALRQQHHNGKVIDVTPHVKYGNRPPKLLRVHYWPDRERRCIVIGHCGDHLRNFSTANA